MSARARRGSDAVREADVVVLGAGAAGLGGARARRPPRGPAGEGYAGRQTGQQPVGAGRHRGRGRPGATRRSSTLPTRSPLRAALGDAARRRPARAEAPQRLAELRALGARFDRDAQGRLDLAREAAHSCASRAARARRDRRRDRARAVGSRSRTSAARPSASGRSRARAGPGRRPRGPGVLARHADGALALHLARAVVLATGGSGRALRAHDQSPPRLRRGSGAGLARRSAARRPRVRAVPPDGARRRRGPAAAPHRGAPRSRGARSSTSTAGGFLADAGPRAELLPRDVVARALWAALASGRRAFLDAREAVGEVVPRALPDGVRGLPRHGLDPRSEPIPVAPAAHYHMGGIPWTSTAARSGSGLWAAGEVACTGVHGANRLASNSLLEGLVFGAGRRPLGGGGAATSGPRSRCAAARPTTVLGARRRRRHRPRRGGGGARARCGRRSAWRRERAKRLRALRLRGASRAWRPPRLEDPALPADPGRPRRCLRPRAARLLAPGTSSRSPASSPPPPSPTESRGAHFRSDHPAADPAWRRRVVLVPEKGAVRIETEAVAAEAEEACA